VIKELTPAIVRKIWGGTKLEKMKGLQGSSEAVEPIGETLEISDIDLTYLAKFIDTSEELSIQVHPGDEYARLHENSKGKTECWIILEALPGAGIYLGLKPHVTKEILKLALKEKKAINELLNFYPVKKGDFFFVPAGSIHAIGKDITLAEVQQNSGITYRVWDWNRLDANGVSRDLHIEKSLDVINFDPAYNSAEYFRFRENTFQNLGAVELCQHPDFHLYLINLESGESYQKNLSNTCSILNLNGKITINQKGLNSFGAVTITDELQLTVTALDRGSFLLIF
jgi:mannose-6-phosphate isomerase